jgi:hypothetical protein
MSSNNMSSIESTNMLGRVLYASSRKRRMTLTVEHTNAFKASKAEPPKQFKVNKKNYPGIDGLRMFYAPDDVDNKSIGRSMVTISFIPKGANIFPAVRWKHPIPKNESIEDHEESVYAETGLRDALIKVNPYLFIPENFKSDSLIDHAWYLMNHCDNGNVTFDLIRQDGMVIGFETVAKRDIMPGEHICFAYQKIRHDAFDEFLPLPNVADQKYAKYLTDISHLFENAWNKSRDE